MTRDAARRARAPRRDVRRARACARAAAMRSSGTPDSRPTASAASTFARLPRPTSGVSIAVRPAGVLDVARHAVECPRSRTSLARTSAGARRAKVRTRPANAGEARRHTRVVGVGDEQRVAPSPARAFRPWRRRSRRSTESARGALRRRWSRRGRRARRCRPACESLPARSCPAPAPPSRRPVGRARHLEQRQRQADVIVEIAPVPERPMLERQKRRGHFLRRRLARRCR